MFRVGSHNMWNEYVGRLITLALSIVLTPWPVESCSAVSCSHNGRLQSVEG